MVGVSESDSGGGGVWTLDQLVGIRTSCLLSPGISQPWEAPKVSNHHRIQKTENRMNAHVALSRYMTYFLFLFFSV